MDGQALPGCCHAKRALQASWWQEHGAAHAGGPRAQQASKLETRALFAGGQGGTVTRAGGNTCGPLSARLDLRPPAVPRSDTDHTGTSISPASMTMARSRRLPRAARSSFAVTTKRESHRKPRSGQAVLHPRSVPVRLADWRTNTYSFLSRWVGRAVEWALLPRRAGPSEHRNFLS